MSLLLSGLTRIASCICLFAVILYAPGFVPALLSPKWVWQARSRPPAVGCVRRLAEAEVRAVRYGAPNRTEAAACVPHAAYRA